MGDLSKKKRTATILLLIGLMCGALLMVFDCDGILYLWDIYEGTKSEPGVSTWIDDFLCAWIDLSELLFFVGLACVLGCWFGLMRLWARKIAWGVTCIFCGLICNGYLVLDTLGFFFLPRGTVTRPMGWVVLVLLISLFAAVVGVTLAIISFAKKEKPVVGAVGLVLALCPYFVSQLLFELAVLVRDLDVAE